MGERSGRSNGERNDYAVAHLHRIINSGVTKILSYDTKLVGARKAGVMRGAIVAVGAGFMWYAFITNCRRYREQYCYHDRRFIIYASYALAFWYGVKLIMDDRDLCEEVRRIIDSVF